MSFTFRLRRDYKWRWERDNPILADGEPGVERDTHKLKLGDGETHWNDLPYSAGEGGGDANIIEHINDPTPHPAYDDMPDLTLIYENVKV